MKKRNSSEILSDPVDYWEKKLNINYETEFIRYKKLCIRKLRKNEIRKLDGIYYITYTAWEQKMIATISPLDESELYEYIHFLKGRTNNHNILSNLVSGYIVPFLVGLFCPYVTGFMTESISTKNASMFITIIVIFFYLLYRFWKMFQGTINDSLTCSFYDDLFHITENHYENVKTLQKTKVEYT